MLDPCNARIHKPDTERKCGGVYAFALVWAVLLTVPLSFFSASHLAVLPVAEKAVTGASGAAGSELRIVHVLAEECPCSSSVLDYLETRGAQSDLSEEVVLLNGTEESVTKLSTLGFRVTLVDSENFCSDFGSEGVPFFQVVSGDAAPAYSGAYFDSAHRAKRGFLDLSTYSEIKNGAAVKSRPVFGCATSNRLKSALDPFGLKY